MGEFGVAVVLLSMLLGGMLKGAVGFGLPLIVTPAMIPFFSLPEIIAFSFLPVMAANAQQVWQTRRCAPVRARVLPLVLVNSALLLGGGFVLASLDGRLLRPLIGALIVLHVVLADRPVVRIPPRASPALVGAGCGAVSGALGCVTSFYGFPSLQFLYALELGKDAFVFAVGVFMLGGHVALWGGVLAATPEVVTGNLALSLACVVPTVAGTWLGNLMRERIDTVLFKRMVRLTLAAVGVMLIALGWL